MSKSTSGIKANWIKASWIKISLALALTLAALCPQAAAQVQASNANATTTTIAANSGSYLGIWLAEVTPQRAKELRLPEASGVIVTLVSPNSPASAAGLRSSDVIVEFNQTKVNDIDHFSKLVRDTPAGRTVRLRIMRDGAVQMLSAKIGSIPDTERPGPITDGVIQPPRQQPDRQDVPRSLMTWRSAVLGVDAEPLFGQLAAYFGVEEGVLVRSVTAGLPAAKAGLKAGDVILRINRATVATPAEITVQLVSSPDVTVKVTLMRDHKEITIPVTME